MPVSDDRMRRILEFDALNEAEKLTGVDYHEDKDTQDLGVSMFLQNAAIKKKELRERNDTVWGMDYLEYLSIVTEMGFKVIKTWEIPRKDRPSETMYFLWNEEHGVPLIFDTYESHVNGSHIYGNWVPNPEIGLSGMHSFISTGCWSSDHEVWCGHWDAREAFRFRFSELVENGTFISPWVDMDWPTFDVTCGQDWPQDVEWVEKERVVRGLGRARQQELPEHIQKCLAVAFKEK